MNSEKELALLILNKFLNNDLSSNILNNNIYSLYCKIIHYEYNRIIFIK